MTLGTVSYSNKITRSPIGAIKYKGLLLVHMAHRTHDESSDTGFLHYNNGEN